MIKTIILDDERHCLITLEHILKQIEDVEILAVLQDSREAKSIIDRLKPDIVFIDIEMPNLSGFEVLEQFESFDFKFVFTTAYDQYAIKALKMNALDYLQKPISYEDVEDVIVKFRQDQIQASKEQLSNVYKFSKDKIQDRLALSVQEGLLFVMIEDIMYVEASGSYSNIVMKDQTKYLISKGISMFEEVLSDHSFFFRAHKSYMISLKFVKQYIRGDGGEIVMHDGKYVNISRNKKAEFLSLFQKI
ncbi:LytR/AlgR family response regulator transcription factor [Soonwooa purpurea]